MLLEVLWKELDFNHAGGLIVLIDLIGIFNLNVYGPILFARIIN